MCSELLTFRRPSLLPSSGTFLSALGDRSTLTTAVVHLLIRFRVGCGERNATNIPVKLSVGLTKYYTMTYGVLN